MEITSRRMVSLLFFETALTINSFAFLRSAVSMLRGVANRVRRNGLTWSSQPSAVMQVNESSTLLLFRRTERLINAGLISYLLTSVNAESPCTRSTSKVTSMCCFFMSRVSVIRFAETVRCSTSTGSRLGVSPRISLLNNAGAISLYHRFFFQTSMVR